MDYLVGPNVITGVLKKWKREARETRKQPEVKPERWQCEKDLAQFLLSLKMGERGYEPRNESSFLKTGKGKEMDFLKYRKVSC